MKKLIGIVFLLSTIWVNAQEFLPFASGSYAGITGVHLQPASIVDSRYKVDIGLSSTSFSLSNNYVSMDNKPLFNRSEFENRDFADLYLQYNDNGKPKSAFVSLRQDVLSFMISITEKDAIAFTPSVRAMINMDGVSQDLLDLIQANWDVPSLFNQQLNNARLSVQANAWAEYGLTYGRVVYDNNEHFVKAGVTLKLLQGLGSGYLFARNIDYQMKNEDTMSIFNSEVNYGVTDNLIKKDNGKNDYQVNSKFTVGMDFGAVYEYRPKWMDYKYDMDGKTNMWRRDQDKYLVKVGISLTDVGRVRYNRGQQTKDFRAHVSEMDIREIGIYDYNDFNDFIDSAFTFYDVTDKYTMNLPMSLSLQADVRVVKGFYVNFVPYLALMQGKNDENKNHYLSSINLIPRYDMDWFGVSLPMQYNSNNKFNVGLGLRLGPMWVGSNDIFSTLISGRVSRASVCVALKVPIMYAAPEDMDKDKVSDKLDQCVDLAGPWELKGCPDRDNDGIIDIHDLCPDTPGIPIFNGCPDRDGDSIIDMNDDCPDDKGLAKYKGCPDTDHDGIIDKEDDCPLAAGIPTFRGCPDTDGDGLADKDDNCPTVPGTIENKGCPFIDSDGDGIADKDDDCPSIPGEKAFSGCPDTDGDGISDKYDMCPTIKGIPENKGCPEIKKEEQETIRKAFDNLEFETGKAIIRTSSYPSLNELADVLKKREDFKLLISGHTDDVGNDASNMTLSKNRTLAVRDYLVGKGIDTSRFKTEWFGETRPLVPNTSPENRQKNRRVEMNIFF